VAPTDGRWYQQLLSRSHLEEVNFWRPGGGTFTALSPGEPFFFKLKSPRNAIGGFGQFALEGREISIPARAQDRPDPALLEWHGDVIFRR
jgi:hypothetical protein